MEFTPVFLDKFKADFLSTQAEVNELFQLPDSEFLAVLSQFFGVG